MTKRSIAFSKRLLAIVKNAGDNNKSFAQAIDVSDNSATNYLKKGRVPEPDILVRISKRYKKSIDWLLQDLFEEQPKEDKNAESPPHSLIIHKFQQKELSWNIISELLKLEGLNPEALQEVGDFIRFKIGVHDRRKGERRRHDAKDFDPGEERRSGLDRRKAVGS